MGTAKADFLVPVVDVVDVKATSNKSVVTDEEKQSGLPAPQAKFNFNANVFVPPVPEAGALLPQLYETIEYQKQHLSFMGGRTHNFEYVLSEHFSSSGCAICRAASFVQEETKPSGELHSYTIPATDKSEGQPWCGHAADGPASLLVCGQFIGANVSYTIPDNDKSEGQPLCGHEQAAEGPANPLLCGHSFGENVSYTIPASDKSKAQPLCGHGHATDGATNLLVCGQSNGENFLHFFVTLLPELLRTALPIALVPFSGLLLDKCAELIEEGLAEHLVHNNVPEKAILAKGASLIEENFKETASLATVKDMVKDIQDEVVHDLTSTSNFRSSIPPLTMAKLGMCSGRLTLTALLFIFHR